MIRIVTCEEMKRMESRTMEKPGIPSLSLMERAAYQSFLRISGHNKSKDGVVVLCGSGNNGGDGFALARILNEHGFKTDVIFAGNPEKMTAEAKLNKDILAKAGVCVTDISNNRKCTSLIKSAGIIVDAFTGIGFKGELRGDIKKAVNFINNKKNDSAVVYSIDIPSGLNGDTGRVTGDCVKADYTITMQFLKRGLILNDGPDYCGNIITESVGIMDDINPPSVFTMGDEIISAIPKRKKTGNKGTFGKVLFVTGSVDMPGAAVLSAKAAFETGCGMVKIITDKAIKDIIIHEVPEAMFQNRDSSDDDIIKSFKWCTSLVIGCGLGTGERAKELLLLALNKCEKPVVIDADGINLMASIGKNELIKLLKVRKRKGYSTIVTPHPGEFGRLFGTDIKDKMNQDIEFVTEKAREYNLIIVAKDAGTVVTDGKQTYIQTVTSDLLATAGSGDVLAGITGAMVHLEKIPFNAAIYSVFIHGKTGKEISKTTDFQGIRASDIIKGINAVY